MGAKVFSIIALVLVQSWSGGECLGQVLEVKPGGEAIVKEGPTGNAAEITRLAPGTRVEQVGEAPRYYSIRLMDGRVGWSYKGRFVVVDADPGVPVTPVITAETLLARSDVLKIMVIDVEVGDATLIICPREGERQDVLLIDTGENDAERIKAELVRNGFVLSGRPITRFIATHYDHDHIGDADDLIPLAEMVYDHGNNNIKTDYLEEVSKPGVHRETMTIDYQETFSGGVVVECVAVNQATDFEPDKAPSRSGDNPNSIAVIISYEGFDYFTGGDLTFGPELSLTSGIRDCDVYHVNHHGSRATSSDEMFVRALDPEVSVVSNGTRHGHPTAEVAKRLIEEVGSAFFQTNANDDPRAHQPEAKFMADAESHEDPEQEELEGAVGTIRIVVDGAGGNYYVLMGELPLSEGTFAIER